ncbi:major facilitator superfamily domain-containing protein [Kockiozyma suomiensis]|uniref:major facilitator superfamily domain-containing protein n=1 Tax=Kockiozyma suomiensis TaxID=1337062 RepID=UPI0033432BFA
MEKLPVDDRDQSSADIEKSEKSVIADPSIPSLLPHELYPPDEGKKAWLCVVGSFCGIFVSFGYINVIGVFNEYYMANQLSDYSPSTVAWISSIETFILIFPGFIIGRLYDLYGPRMLIVPGSILLLLGVFTTSVSKEYYQFMLAQGFCTSIGASLIFNPCLGALAGWFRRKRGAAMGIAVSGSSLGGVIMPIMFREITARSGFGWAVRAIGFLMAGMIIVACLTVNSRIRPAKSMPADDSHHFNMYNAYIAPFKSLQFSLVVLSMFFIYWGLFIPIGYIPSHAVAHGFSESLSLYLIAILNAASVFGRLIPGFLADKIGRFEVFIVAGVGTGILVLALWLPATGHVPIILFAALYGFFSGSAVSVMPAIAAEISPIREIGTRWGIISAAGSLGALSGLPIAGAIVSSNGGKYWGTSIFSGISILVGCVLITLVFILRRREQRASK